MRFVEAPIGVIVAHTNTHKSWGLALNRSRNHHCIGSPLLWYHERLQTSSLQDFPCPSSLCDTSRDALLSILLTGLFTLGFVVVQYPLTQYNGHPLSRKAAPRRTGIDNVLKLGRGGSSWPPSLCHMGCICTSISQGVEKALARPHILSRPILTRCSGRGPAKLTAEKKTLTFTSFRYTRCLQQLNDADSVVNE